MMVESIDHVNIIVDDIEAMTEFYRDVIGFEEMRRASISGDWIDRLTGLEGVEADVVYLEPPGGPGVELIGYRRPEGSRPDGLGQPQTKGIRHIALRVDDIEAAVEALRGAGVEMLSEVQRVPDVQVSYSGGKRLVYCRDPEGNLLELCAYGS